MTVKRTELQLHDSGKEASVLPNSKRGGKTGCTSQSSLIAVLPFCELAAAIPEPGTHLFPFSPDPLFSLPSLSHRFISFPEPLPLAASTMCLLCGAQNPCVRLLPPSSHLTDIPAVHDSCPSRSAVLPSFADFLFSLPFHPRSHIS